MFFSPRTVNFESGLDFQMQFSAQWAQERAPSHADPPFITQIQMQEKFPATRFSHQARGTEDNGTNFQNSLLTPIICGKQKLQQL